MKALLSLFAAVALSSGAAQAQSNLLSSGSPTDIIPNFNVQNLQAAVTAAGYSVTLLNNNQVVGVETPAGVRFVMFPTACQTGTCTGVSLQGWFRGPQLPLEVINSFNSAGPIPKAVRVDDGVNIYHYMIADYGIIRGNFNSHMQVMDHALRTFIQGLNSGGGASPQSVAVSLDGGDRMGLGGALLIDSPHDAPEMTESVKSFLRSAN